MKKSIEGINSRAIEAGDQIRYLKNKVDVDGQSEQQQQQQKLRGWFKRCLGKHQV